MVTQSLYHYRAIVTAVYDGDTCTVDIDLGLNAWIRNEKVRLYRINSPEVRGIQRDEGLVSRDYLRSLILNKKVVIQTFKDRREKYGRYLADIWLQQADGTYLNINDHLVQSGHAQYKAY